MNKEQAGIEKLERDIRYMRNIFKRDVKDWIEETLDDIGIYESSDKDYKIKYESCKYDIMDDMEFDIKEIEKEINGLKKQLEKIQND